MVARAVERDARFDDALDRLGEALAVGEANRGVVEAGRVAGGGPAPFDSQVFRPMWW